MKITHNGREYEVEFINDDGEGMCGKLFLIGHEFGATSLVSAEHEGGAWEAWLDEQETIPADEEHEAYGLSEQEFNALCSGSDGPIEQEFNALCSGSDGPIELVEGYEYQPSFPGTGIVNVGHYVWIKEVTVHCVHLLSS